jgi:hypothetical protein
VAPTVIFLILVRHRVSFKKRVIGPVTVKPACIGLTFALIIVTTIVITKTPQKGSPFIIALRQIGISGLLIAKICLFEVTLLFQLGMWGAT